jgi:hypothetical protein
MQTIISKADRLVKAAEVIEKNEGIGGGLTLPAENGYIFKLRDDDKSHLIREIELKNGINKGKVRKIFEVVGDVICDGRTYKNLTLAVPANMYEFWAAMQTGISYIFDVTTYQTTRLINGVQKEVEGKSAANWSVKA